MGGGDGAVGQRRSRSPATGLRSLAAPVPVLALDQVWLSGLRPRAAAHVSTLASDHRLVEVEVEVGLGPGP